MRSIPIIQIVTCLVVWPALLPGQVASVVSKELPPAAVSKLAGSLAAATSHRHHVWRDSAPTNSDATVNAFVEIARGDRRKWEFDMKANLLAIDRVLPDSVGGYPVNYGFVPQTVSYDGDPFDALVLGPPLPSGKLVRGAIVGLMRMEDQAVNDAKVVLSPLDPGGEAQYALGDLEREAIADYFNRYKRHEGKSSHIPGWGTPDDGRAYLEVAHAFFTVCAGLTGACRLP